jgi:GNAT superfamily N-acetyltransferase
MFQVKTMRPTDYQYATELANTMNWNMTNEDFAFNNSLEPDGCFVLYENFKRLGIATCISYGKTGWFGNLIVNQDSRRKGAGSFLVRHALEFLRGKGVENVGLYAYPQLVDFYGKIGFKVDEDFSVLHAQDLKTIQEEALPEIGKPNIDAIARFDADCFGGDRKRLLHAILQSWGNLAYYVAEGKNVVGYITAKVYEGVAEVGPLACDSRRLDVALNLLKSSLSKLAHSEIYLYLPKHQTVLQNYLRSVGFKEEFYLTRMFLVRNLSKNCIYIAESLERG